MSCAFVTHWLAWRGGGGLDDLRVLRGAMRRLQAQATGSKVLLRGMPPARLSQAEEIRAATVMERPGGK